MEPKHYLMLASLVSYPLYIMLIRDRILSREQELGRSRILQLLVIVHAWRFVGLGMYVPGIAPELPEKFVYATAWGDYIAAIMAIIVYVLLGRKSSLALVGLWVFNLWGFLDILYAGYQAAHLKVAAQMGVMFFVFAGYAPLLIVSHIAIFRKILQKQ